MRKNDVQWLDRTLFLAPMFYGLATREEQFYNALKRMKIGERPEFLSDRAQASTHFFALSRKDKGVGGPSDAAIVSIRPHKSLVAISSLLAHEAMHIWQRIRVIIGEKEPSDEFEAYAVQNITGELIEAYVAQMRGRK